MKKIILLIICLITISGGLLYYWSSINISPWNENPLPKYTNENLFELFDSRDQSLGIFNKSSATETELFNSKPTAYEKIPPFLISAFINSEDKRYYQHNGIDWFARVNALITNVLSLEVVRGASTITEQTVRIIRKRPRTYYSRWIEGFEAVQLEQVLDKRTILEFYLNQVPFGSNKRGIAQAADFYFGRSLSTLNEKEMLTLAVIVRAPSYLNPRQSLERVEKRVNLLSEQMLLNNVINVYEFNMIQKQEIEIDSSPEPPDMQHFSKYITKNLTHIDSKVKTNINSELQLKSQHFLNSSLERLAKHNVHNGAVLVVDHQINQIISWVVGFAGESDTSGNAYDAVTVPRQPGSTLKPFIYARALSLGANASDTIDDSPLNESVGQGLHQYRNYSGSYYGPVTLRDALGNSLNIPAVKTLQTIGVNTLIDDLKSMGVNGLEEHPNVYGDGLALGNGALTLFELVQAYTVLARHGLYKPLSITSDSYNSDKRIYDEEVASLISNILSDEYARELEFGTDSILNFSDDIAVKTGTSNDFRDAWIVGYNDKFTVGVWMGNLDYQEMDKITGAKGPAEVLRSIMNELNRNREPKPLYISPFLKKKTICKSKNSDGSCNFYDEYFLPNSKPNILIDSSYSETPFRIQYPTPNLLMALDPRIPDELEIYRFKINRTENFEYVTWLLDEAIIYKGKKPYYDWKITKGKHQVKAIIDLSSGKRINLDSVKFEVR